MISYLKNLKFSRALNSHANFGYKPRISSYNNGDSIAILTDLKHQSIIESFVKKISHKSTKVSVLYFESDSKESEQGYTAKDLNWAEIPISEKVDSFLAQEYDRFYFIDNIWSKHFYFISRLVKCRLSVGPLLKEIEFHFDLSIDIENKSVDYLATKIKSEVDHLSI